MNIFQFALGVCLTVFAGFQNVSAQQLKIETVREQFFTLDKTENGALKLYKSLENIDLSKDPVMLAYRGAASAASAGSVNGVRKKLEYFNRGKNELEKAVAMKHIDAEIRFLRLATQVNAPGFLGYTGDIKNDKALLIQLFTSVNANHPNAYLYLRICRFMHDYAKLDNSEKNTVNQLIVKFNSKK
jgi:hypothetical protein